VAINYRVGAEGFLWYRKKFVMKSLVADNRACGQRGARDLLNVLRTERSSVTVDSPNSASYNMQISANAN
jgi:hypothetical protein